MGKILSAQLIKEADLYTIKHEPITSIDLMERASSAFVDRLFTIIPHKSRVLICCGTGNNGGDGLAIGRMLHYLAFPVNIVVLGDPNLGSPDFKTNLQRAKDAAITLSYVTDLESLNRILDNGFEVVVDAIFGSGLSRPLGGLFASTILEINNRKAIKLSVDIASGLYADQHTPEDATVFMPDYTITFQVPKLAFFLPQYHRFVGELFVEDIGLDQDFIAKASSPFSTIGLDEATNLLKPRAKYAHKGNFGHVLLIAGSKGKMGAAILAAKATLRAGAGLVTVCCTATAATAIHVAVPEAMVLADEHPSHISHLPDLSHYDAVAVGPGLGQHADTVAFMHNLLTNCKVPMVIDADALNIIASTSGSLAIVPLGAVLTPHPKEFERLAGKTLHHFERLEVLRALSEKYKLNILIKGANSAVCDAQGNVSFNTNGNPGMATAGSGDVLTGIIAGLLAQGYLPNDALKLAVFLHGLSGDLVAQIVGQQAIIASDLISHLGLAFKTINERKINIGY